VRLRTASRIVARHSWLERYHAFLLQAARLSRLGRPSRGRFARHALRDLALFLIGGVQPVRGEAEKRAFEATGWILRAQAATPDAGVSYGYFPCHKTYADGWLPSYPETTGYIIPTMLQFARQFGRPEVKERAVAMADWEIEVQMPTGAVQGGFLSAPDRRVPAVFNTGMVLHGLTEAFRSTGEERFLTAGRRAADFLVSDLGEDGHFRTHGQFVVTHAIKTYNCLCAWGLWRYGEDAADARYRAAAIRSIEGALGQQQANGWFANSCLMFPDSPLTHTLAYTLQGILEVGLLAGRDDFVGAARRGVEALLHRMAPDGFLPGCFFSDWEPAVVYSCLTGNAQLAVIAYRLHEATASPQYREAADRLIDFLKALQSLDPGLPGAQGAIPGSFPLLANYQSLGYPNWATKYFLDGLMAQHRLETRAGA
jgi:hypothetical protein